jgi:uncharacterized delta-60 repeat protein
MSRTKVLLSIAISSALAARPAAGAGVLDPSFGVGGLAIVQEVGVFYEVAVQPDGKIVASGSSGCTPTFCGSSVPFLVRFNADGTLDGTFGAGGIRALAEFDVRSFVPVALEADGHILSSANTSVGRYSAGGVLEATFAIPSSTTRPAEDGVHGLAIQPDGKIVALIGFGIVRYEADGAPDLTFGVDGFAPGLGSLAYGQLALQADGKIVAAGILGIVRHNNDGSIDPLGPDGFIVMDRGASTVLVQPDGKIVATSRIDHLAATKLVELRRFLPDGTPDPSFGVGGVATTPVGFEGGASDTALQADGKLVVVGSAATGGVFSPSGIFVGRYTADGNADLTFGNAGVMLVGSSTFRGVGHGVAIQPDGKLVAAGSGFDLAAGTSGATLLRLADGVPTPAGSFVSVDLGGVGVTFASVTTAGTTTFTTSMTAPALPAGYQLGSPALYYDVQTTATYGGPVTTCFHYDATTFPDPGLAQLLHHEAGSWMVVTVSNDTTNFIICGSTMSLSPFAIAAAPDDPAFLIQQLIGMVENARLDAKLAAARDALEAAKRRSIEKACKKMDAFSQVVQRQTGRELTAAQAAHLLAQARRIRQSLGCP